MDHPPLELPSLNLIPGTTSVIRVLHPPGICIYDPFTCFIHFLKTLKGFLLLGQVGATLELGCTAFFLWRLLLWNMDSWCEGSVVVTDGLSCPMACGVFHQGLNPCLLHWQVDSQPLDRQGSPYPFKNTTDASPLCWLRLYTP